MQDVSATTFALGPCLLVAALLLHSPPGAAAAPAAAPAATLRIGAAPISRTNRNYASWNIDSSYNRGFFHMNFSNPNLRAAAESLAPSTLRFGGTGNDYLHYACTTEPGRDNDTYGCLNASHRADLLGLAAETGTDFLFGVSFDVAAACAQSTDYIWQTAEVEFLLGEMQRDGQAVWGFELGNEINNRAPGGNQDCGLVPRQQSGAMRTFAELLQAKWPNPTLRPKLIGPDTGYHDAPAWLNATLAEAGDLLHAVTHHVYPGIHRDNFNVPSAFDKIVHGDMSWYPQIVAKRAPSAQMWAGEDGPAGGGESGTCSGTTGDPHNISACGLFATVLWYADDMALRATHGFKQYQRQDFVGGRYSLIGTEHDNEYEPESSPVEIHPDFWVNFLWKRTMGTGVLNASLVGSSPDADSHSNASPPDTLRAYAHCGMPASKYHVDGSGGMTLLLINLDNSSADAILTVPGALSTTKWTLTPGAGGPFGASAQLNGVDLQTKISTGKPINAVPVPGATISGERLSLPPLSVSFVVVKSSEGGNNSCSGNTRIREASLTARRPLGAACDASDTLLLELRDILCKSLAMQCGTVHPSPNATAQGDWPSQAVYMNDLLTAVAAVPTTYSGACLQTPTAMDVIEWLADTSRTTPWWNTWVTFQVQYYDMPRKPGERIESAATLGRKCWAFSYLDRIWARLKPALASAMAHASHGVTLGKFFDTWERAVAETMPLCHRVMANCFVNASYDPSARNGTCPDKVGAFYVGWQWENGGGGREPNAPRPEIPYPFPMYSQTAEFHQDVSFAVATALNEII